MKNFTNISEETNQDKTFEINTNFNFDTRTYIILFFLLASIAWYIGYSFWHGNTDIQDNILKIQQSSKNIKAIKTQLEQEQKRFNTLISNENKNITTAQKTLEKYNVKFNTSLIQN